MTNKSVNLSFYSNLDTKPSATRVVHCKKNKYDVYIGRPSIWGNPYSSKQGTLAEYLVKDKSEALKKYELYLESSPKLLNELKNLKGKVLGCWCYPNSCHGDVIIKLIEKYYSNENIISS